MKQREQIHDEIVEIVNRETRAWDTKDAELLISVFHPDMVWPWPRTAQSHDPMDWVMVLGRYDRERWKQVWQQLFDTHTLSHNHRRIQKIEISEQGDGASPTAKTFTGKDGRARSTAGSAANGK
ncbi:MAG: nuclear transport factor 2 family protein [Acidobacteriia bacterium]|nr:nuclear transport factor 2 family protein [Terriglobia bacterium]